MLCRACTYPDVGFSTSHYSKERSKNIGAKPTSEPSSRRAQDMRPATNDPCL
ncbi:hypothetical protein DPMN_171232 [Dreissena polymorpha]|uniref:Uncharacterized protein n=1 Tax=Dreissena polymorpha TaxID=45954 RepID=A0A9D4IFD5_DREPO|nr:hypothetical protein DPMN_171232 [Dreissena polymorpha]